MAAPPYQKLFWGSYHKHTAHLRHAREHGAYLLLIGALWNNDGKLPADDETLAAYAMLTVKEWAAVRPKLMPLFRVVRGKLTQLRVTEDLAKYRDTSGKRKEAGKAGGMARAGKHREIDQAIATVLPTKPEPESEDNPPAPQGGKARSARFEEAWKAYHARGVGNRGKAEAWVQWPAAAESAGGEDRLVSAVQAHMARLEASPKQTPRAFHRWLRDGGFEAYLVAGEKPNGRCWTGPPEVWDLVARERSPKFAHAWLGDCVWQDYPRAIVSPSGTVIRRLRDELGPVLRDEGIGLEERA